MAQTANFYRSFFNRRAARFISPEFHNNTSVGGGPHRGNVINDSCLPLLDMLRELREVTRIPLNDSSVAPLYIRARPAPSSSSIRHAISSRMPMFSSNAPITTQVAVGVWNAVLPWERTAGLSAVPAETLQSGDGNGFPFPRIWEDMRESGRGDGGGGNHGGEQQQIISPARGMLFVNTPLSGKSTFWCGDIRSGLDVAFVASTQQARRGGGGRGSVPSVWRRSMSSVTSEGPRGGGADSFLGGAEMAAEVMGVVDTVLPLHPKQKQQHSSSASASSTSSSPLSAKGSLPTIVSSHNPNAVFVLELPLHFFAEYGISPQGSQVELLPSNTLGVDVVRKFDILQEYVDVIEAHLTTLFKRIIKRATSLHYNGGGGGHRDAASRVADLQKGRNSSDDNVVPLYDEEVELVALAAELGLSGEACYAVMGIKLLPDLRRGRLSTTALKRLYPLMTSPAMDMPAELIHFFHAAFKAQEAELKSNQENDEEEEEEMSAKEERRREAE